jgi:hypothetical protein
VDDTALVSHASAELAVNELDLLRFGSERDFDAAAHDSHVLLVLDIALGDSERCPAELRVDIDQNLDVGPA